MKLLAIASLIYFALIACSQGPSAETSTAQADPVMELGDKVYRLNCRICHGRRGNAGLGGAKKLGKSIISQEEAIQVITKGRNKMQAYEEILTEEEIQAVSTYIQKFKKK